MLASFRAREQAEEEGTEVSFGIIGNKGDPFIAEARPLFKVKK